MNIPRTANPRLLRRRLGTLWVIVAILVLLQLCELCGKDVLVAAGSRLFTVMAEDENRFGSQHESKHVDPDMTSDGQNDKGSKVTSPSILESARWFHVNDQWALVYPMPDNPYKWQEVDLSECQTKAKLGKIHTIQNVEDAQLELVFDSEGAVLLPSMLRLPRRVIVKHGGSKATAQERDTEKALKLVPQTRSLSPPSVKAGGQPKKKQSYEPISEDSSGRADVSLLDNKNLMKDTNEGANADVGTEVDTEVDPELDSDIGTDLDSDTDCQSSTESDIKVGNANGGTKVDNTKGSQPQVQAPSSPVAASKQHVQSVKTLAKPNENKTVVVAQPPVNKQQSASPQESSRWRRKPKRSVKVRHSTKTVRRTSKSRPSKMKAIGWAAGGSLLVASLLAAAGAIIITSDDDEETEEEEEEKAEVENAEVKEAEVEKPE
eukprot:GHVT01021158.1.p1 GENE.GHVT01021158.1~~GHVT01021158.1.p1  ORF type:complete len:434 (-),score=47.29 GHVT01021158.1:458-1759(-)